jgi:membrane protein DedA with SNARE-associated domain
MHGAMDFLLRHGYVVIFVAVFIEQVGLPIPSGPVLLAAGRLGAEVCLPSFHRTGYVRLQDAFRAPALWPGVVADFEVSALVRHPGPHLAGMFNLALWKFLLIDAGGALLWAGAYIGTCWLFRRQLENVVAALSRFGAAIAIALGPGVLAYLVCKSIALWRIHRPTGRIA